MCRHWTEFDVADGRFIMAPTGLSGVRSVLAESHVKDVLITTALFTAVP